MRIIAMALWLAMPVTGQHWAFRPIPESIDAPQVRAADWPRDPLDRHVLAAIEAAGLEPAPDADRRTWIRRVTFDLCGLPPSVEAVEAFVADRDPHAKDRVVNRLLASPAYGERQARLWLDLVRYADSNGLDENLAFANAWRYRDWVVRALNADLPYDDFVVLQLAGDLLPPSDDPAVHADRITATGFWSLGPKVLAEQDKAKLVMDVVDEQIDVLTRTVLGLTVACARCHDHKFDPIAQRDYYALAGILKSTSTMADLEHVSRWREIELATPAQRAAREAWSARMKELDGELAAVRVAGERALEESLREDLAAYLLAGVELARASVVVEAETFARGNLRVDRARWGSASTPVVHTQAGGLQWAEWEIEIPSGGDWELQARFAAAESRPLRLLLDGRPIAEEALGDTTGGWLPAAQRWSNVASLRRGAGRVVLRLESAGAIPHLDKWLLWPAERATGRLAPEYLRAIVDFCANPARAADPHFGRWHELAGLAPETWAARAAEIEALAARDQAALREDGERLAAILGADGLLGSRGPIATTSLPAAERRRLDALQRERAALAAEQPPAYPTALGVADGAVADVPIHLRGNHLQLADEPTPRGAIALFDDQVPQLAIEAGHSGRLELAERLVDPRHPLVARVIVNRIWQSHFGHGLVRTPSNFGPRGEPPTHPALLDTLARDFVTGGWSIKALHRRIVLSRTYGLSSAPVPGAERADPDDRLLASFPRQRLSAEALRDAILAVAGTLDRRLGGSLLTTGNREYVTNDQSQDLARYDSTRRSLYLPLIRNALYDQFTLFDYNDASVPVARRPQTTVPIQALWLMNSDLVQAQSLAFARRLRAEVGDDPTGRLDRAFRLAYARPPREAERQVTLGWLNARSADGAAEAGDDARWARLCQVLFASNDFLYVD